MQRPPGERPAKKDSHILTIRVERWVADGLKQIASKERRSINAVVALALEALVRRRVKKGE